MSDTTAAAFSLSAMFATGDTIDMRDLVALLSEADADPETFDAEHGDGAAAWLRNCITEFASDLGYGLDGIGEYAENEPTLIHDDHFADYAKELAEDLDMIPSEARWPFTCIDWDAAAEELQADYSSATLDRETYWVRTF
jgi:hypothetical protein